ncbi:MAG: hypothetical protein IJ106_10985 [Parasporobacterium sp.]|nr:hypothetical protein [Parasporobacterium sp.]
MKDIKELAARIRELHREYLQGKETSLEELQTLAWVAEIPVDFVQELLSLEDVPGQDAETDKEILDAYSDALRELEELKQENAKLQESADDAREKTGEAQKHQADAEDFKNLAESYSRELEDLKALRDSDQARIRSLEDALKKKDRKCVTLLCYGDEKNLYPGEQTEIVMDILSGILKNLPEGSRRKDILESVVDANPVQGIPKILALQVKQLFREDRQMDDRFEADLKKMGFDVKRVNKHYSLSYRGDDRYTATVPSTKSDKRAGQNLASEIVKKMF